MREILYIVAFVIIPAAFGGVLAKGQGRNIIIWMILCGIFPIALVSFFFLKPIASGSMRFRNPQNDYVEEITLPGLWCFLFGSIYLAIKGVWGHALASFVLAALTCGISWIIYPFFAASIVRTSYLRRGWLEV